MMSPTWSFRSSAVRTSRTPGRRRAFAVLIERIRACAYGLRTNFAKTVPGGSMSATKFPRPVRNRSSSLRKTDSPNTFVVWAIVSPLPGPHHFTRGRDRVDDVLIASASAEVPRDRAPDPVFRRRVFHLQELQSCEHDPGSAEPALEAVVGFERLLNRMEPTLLGEALDRRDLAAVRLDRKHRARLDGVAVQEDGAGAAMARITPNMGSCEPEFVSDEVYEQHARLDHPRVLPTIDGDRNGVAAVVAPNALSLRTHLLSLGRHPNHLPVRAVALSSARRVNTSIIARLYSSLPRRSDDGCASSEASFAASANAAGPALLPMSAFSKARRAVPQSDAGSACARAPPIVPRLRTCGSPRTAATSERIEYFPRMSFDRSKSRCRLNAPIRKRSPRSSMNARPGRSLMSTSKRGFARRSLRTGIRL